MRVVVFLATVAAVAFATSPDPTPDTVKVIGKNLLVDDKPFHIQGMCYSPAPVGESPIKPPFGDYYTPDYAYIWKRDLPLMKKMGANTIRIYGWDTTHDTDHHEFLDEVYKNGLKVLLTFYVGTMYEEPPVYVNTPDLRDALYFNFTREVTRYGDHPAILLWSFGNELNGPWNGFIPQFNEENNCGWDPSGFYPGGDPCYNAENTNSPECFPKNDCIYKALFGFINDASNAAKAGTTRPIISGFADVDRVVDKKQDVSKIALFGHYLPNLGAYAMQLYRGKTFGSYFKYYEANSVELPKPLFVTEYGIDAYNDPCGWPENQGAETCKNLAGDGQGGVKALPGKPFVGCTKAPDQCGAPGGETQAEWDVLLTNELIANYPADDTPTTGPPEPPVCAPPYPAEYPECEARMQWIADHPADYPSIDGQPCSIQAYLADEGGYCPDPNPSTGGSVIGGFLMAWMDEYWKGFDTQAKCSKPCPIANYSQCIVDPWWSSDFKHISKGGECNWKAHITCKNEDSTYHGLCGYWLESAPDLYVNEEWFGMTVPSTCNKWDATGKNHGLDALDVTRPILKAMQQLWAPEEYAKGEPFSTYTCEELTPCWQCIHDNYDPETDRDPASFTCAEKCWTEPEKPTPAPVVDPTPAPPDNPTPAPPAGPTPEPPIKPTPAPPVDPSEDPTASPATGGGSGGGTSSPGLTVALSLVAVALLAGAGIFLWKRKKSTALLADQYYDSESNYQPPNAEIN